MEDWEIGIVLGAIGDLEMLIKEDMVDIEGVDILLNVLVNLDTMLAANKNREGVR